MWSTLLSSHVGLEAQGRGRHFRRKTPRCRVGSEMSQPSARPRPYGPGSPARRETCSSAPSVLPRSSLMRPATCSAPDRRKPMATTTLSSPRRRRTRKDRSGGRPRELAEPTSTSAKAGPLRTGSGPSRRHRSPGRRSVRRASAGAVGTSTAAGGCPPPSPRTPHPQLLPQLPHTLTDPLQHGDLIHSGLPRRHRRGRPFSFKSAL